MLGHEELCEKMGFRVARSYHRLLEVAGRVRPGDPWNAFEKLGLMNLDAAGEEALSYTAPGDFVIFGWTGCDSGHYGFVLDDGGTDEGERPIAVNHPDGTGEGLEALTLAEFLGQLCAPAGEETGVSADDPWEVEKRRLAQVLREEMGVVVPETRRGLKEAAWAERLRRGAVPTEDRIGVVVPEDVVDRRYLAGLRWRDPEAVYSFEKLPADERRLDEAERRLARGEVGTALVVARDFRFHHWYDDWKGSRAYLRRTCEILEKAYAALGRRLAARVVRERTEMALTDVI